MDQVDSILISNLNSLGCELEDDVVSLSQFGLEEVVRGVVSCLRVVCPDACADMSHNLPHNMAHRFRAAAAIAQQVKSLGYTGDLGYQSLLYPVAVDVRRLFSFLLERLPQDAGLMPQEALGGAGLLISAARRRLQEQLSRPWLPPHTKKAVLARRQHRAATELAPLGDTRHLRRHRCHHLIRLGAEHQKSTERRAPVCLRNVLCGDGDTSLLLCSVMAAHARQLQAAQLVLPGITTPGTKLDPLYQDDPQQLLQVPSPSTDSLGTPLSPLSPMATLTIREETVEQIASDPSEEEKIKELQASITALLQQNQKYLETIEQTKEDSEKLSAEASAAAQKEEELRHEVSSLQRALELLPAGAENTARLEAVINASDSKMARLKDQFAAHVTPLTEHLDKMTQLLDNRQSEQEALAGEIQTLRSQRQALQGEVPRVQAQGQLMGQRLKERGQAVGRSVYTKRILEITGKAQQQRRATEAVIQHVNKMQKAINSLAGKIDRSFTVIEEVSYQASLNNPKANGLYQEIIDLHDTSNGTVAAIRETGALKRQIAELEEQVLFEERRETGKALQKLQQDLIAIKQENATLKNKLQQNVG